MGSEGNLQSPQTIASYSVDGPLFKKSAVEAGSLKDFITANLRTPPAAATPETTPVITKPEPAAPVAEAPAPAAPVAAAATKETVETAGEFVPEVPESSTSVEASGQELSVEEEFPDLDPKTPTVEVNFKKLRSNYKAEKEAHKKAQEALAAREAELEEYRTGKKLPDTVHAQEEELTQLRSYKKIVDLKATPEYQEKYVSPLKEVGTTLKTIFTDYDIPEEVLDEARSLTNEAQLNRFVSDHFDSTGALEVKALLKKEKEITRSMQEAEKEPQSALDKLLQESNRAREARRAQEKQAIKSTFSDTWAKSIQKIREEGQFSELIHKPGNTEYNTKVVDPIIRGAATEAGKLLAMLVEDGLTKLRPEVGEYLSRMSLLGHSSAINAVTRERAMSAVRELEKNTERVNSIARPAIGMSTGATATPPAARERLTPETAAKKIAESLGKR